MSGATAGLAIEIDERGELLGRAANDRKREGKTELPGARDGLRASTDRDPHRQGILYGARIHAEIVQRRTMFAAPRDALGLAQLQQKLELLAEQRVVVAQIEAEERKRFDERAAARHDLGASVREQIDRGERLRDAHGI